MNISTLRFEFNYVQYESAFQQQMCELDNPFTAILSYITKDTE
jgi:hypothetical protein